MSRIKTRFERLKVEGRGALIPYLEAYDPDFETSCALLNAMPAAGADLIEIGVPFSDPSADGRTIQASAVRALQAGATLKGTLEMVRQFRRSDAETPIILMGYFNPIDSYGTAGFCADAAGAGVDGLIIVDLPKEEDDQIAAHAAAHDLDIIRLVAPNTPDARLPYLLHGATGFIYYVSITGITGTHTASRDELTAALPRIRAVSDLPIAVGFGIRTPAQAASAVQVGDAAVVASALINTLAESLADTRPTPQTVPKVLAHLRQFAEALREANVDS